MLSASHVAVTALLHNQGDPVLNYNCVTLLGVFYYFAYFCHKNIILETLRETFTIILKTL